MPPRYRAHASVELAGWQESLLGIDDLAPTAPESRSPVPADVAARVRILRSDGLRQVAIERLIDVHLGPPDPKWAASVYSASSDVEITSTDDGRIIDISCQTASPEGAAGMVNALADLFVATERENRLAQLAENRQWIESQLEALAARIQRSEDLRLAEANPVQEKLRDDRRAHREADVNRDLYAAFLKSVPQLGIAAGKVRVLETAAVPSEPLGLRPMLGATAGMLTGMLAVRSA